MVDKRTYHFCNTEEIDCLYSIGEYQPDWSVLSKLITGSSNFVADEMFNIDTHHLSETYLIILVSINHFINTKAIAFANFKG